MSTCRDCISYDRCQKNYLMQVADLLQIDIDTLDKGRNKGKFNIDNDKVCEFFKDKSKIVELPCEVGDTVYYFNTKPHIALYQNKIYEATVVRIVIIATGCSLVIQIRDESGCCEIPNIKDFGKTVFLTKEEAEKALNNIQKKE